MCLSIVFFFPFPFVLAAAPESHKETLLFVLASCWAHSKQTRMLTQHYTTYGHDLDHFCSTQTIFFFIICCFLFSGLWWAALVLCGRTKVEMVPLRKMEKGVSKPLQAPAVNLDYPTIRHALCFVTSSQHEKPKGELNRSISALNCFITFLSDHTKRNQSEAPFPDVTTGSLLSSGLKPVIIFLLHPTLPLQFFIPKPLPSTVALLLRKFYHLSGEVSSSFISSPICYVKYHSELMEVQFQSWPMGD